MGDPAVPTGFDAVLRTDQVWLAASSDAGLQLGLSTRRILGWLALLGAAFALLVSVVANVSTAKDDAALLREGSTAKAVVVEEGFTGRRRQNYVVVEFVPATGARTQRAEIRGPSFISLPKGSTVTVYFDPETPGHVRTRKWANHADGLDHLRWMAPTATVALLGTTAYLFVSGWRRRRVAARSVSIPVTAVAAGHVIELTGSAFTVASVVVDRDAGRREPPEPPSRPTGARLVPDAGSQALLVWSGGGTERVLLAETPSAEQALRAHLAACREL